MGRPQWTRSGHFSGRSGDQKFLYHFFIIQGHSAEVICLSFNSVGESLLTGSFDHTVSVWDVATGK